MNHIKPYFTKYLPVEGETREGDKFNSLHGELPGSQHVRLFLCSKDIKVGDGVIYENTTYKVRSDKPKVGGEGLELVHEVHPGVLIVDQDKCIKVIGEISPEATWVKEGDGFEEDEIKIITKKRFDCTCEKLDPKAYRANPDCSYLVDDHRGGDFCIHQIDVVDKVQIKGSCGHYH